MTSTIKEVLIDTSTTLVRLQQNIRACQLERSRNSLHKIRRELDGSFYATTLALNQLVKMDMDCKVFNIKLKETKDDKV